MGRKVLALINSDAILSKSCADIDQRRKHMEQRIEFMQRQLKNEAEKLKEQDDKDWEIIKNRLDEMGVLKKKDYNPEKQNIAFDLEANAIELCERRKGHPLLNMLGIEIE